MPLRFRQKIQTMPWQDLTGRQMDTSPLAPARFPDLEAISGVRLSVAAAGIKYPGRDDLMLARFDSNTTVAGVLTRSKTASAPVLVCRDHLKGGRAGGLIVNSGNANTFTGRLGERHCQMICEAVAGSLSCKPEEIFAASTGVIGEPLPMHRIEETLAGLCRNSHACFEDAARAIMTTDTFAKGAGVRSNIGDTEVRINGIAKGSGMIEPDMATMLAFIFTDADIPANILQTLLEDANHNSFNAITVDSDTSTSDTCLLFATGKAGNIPPSGIDDASLDHFRQDLQALMLDLAKQVVRDGEGATKLIEIRVTGAGNDSAARVIGKSIANSPLVKTAIAGEDANWGRIVMAAGKSGMQVDRDKLSISMGNVAIARNGHVVDGYDEDEVTAHLEGQTILIDVDVGVGEGESVVWTCDLTHGYITINADYRS